MEQNGVTQLLLKGVEGKLDLSPDSKHTWAAALSLVLGTSNCYCENCNEWSKKYWDLKYKRAVDNAMSG